MGTAPGTQQHPAMPNPVRVANRSFALLKRWGMDDQAAWQAIRDIALVVRNRIKFTHGGDVAWLETIVATADNRLGSITPSVTHRKDTHHGDGSSSSTGRENKGPGRPS